MQQAQVTRPPNDEGSIKLPTIVRSEGHINSWRIAPKRAVGIRHLFCKQFNSLSQLSKLPFINDCNKLSSYGVRKQRVLHLLS